MVSSDGRCVAIHEPIVVMRLGHAHLEFGRIRRELGDFRFKVDWSRVIRVGPTRRGEGRKQGRGTTFHMKDEAIRRRSLKRRLEVALCLFCLIRNGRKRERPTGLGTRFRQNHLHPTVGVWMLIGRRVWSLRDRPLWCGSHSRLHHNRCLLHVLHHLPSGNRRRRRCCSEVVTFTSRRFRIFALLCALRVVKASCMVGGQHYRGRGWARPLLWRLFKRYLSQRKRVLFQLRVVIGRSNRITRTTTTNSPKPERWDIERTGLEYRCGRRRRS